MKAALAWFVVGMSIAVGMPASSAQGPVDCVYTRTKQTLSQEAPIFLRTGLAVSATGLDSPKSAPQLPEILMPPSTGPNDGFGFRPYGGSEPAIAAYYEYLGRPWEYRVTGSSECSQTAGMILRCVQGILEDPPDPQVLPELPGPCGFIGGDAVGDAWALPCSGVAYGASGIAAVWRMEVQAEGSPSPVVVRYETPQGDPIETPVFAGAAADVDCSSTPTMCAIVRLFANDELVASSQACMAPDGGG